MIVSVNMFRAFPFSGAAGAVRDFNGVNLNSKLVPKFSLVAKLPSFSIHCVHLQQDYQLDKRTLSSFWKRMFETNFSSSRTYSSTMDFDLSSEEVQSSPSDLNLEYGKIRVE